MAESILTLENVAVAFGALRAVDGVSTTVTRGERRALIGPNGAGKTTLFNAVTGMYPPTEGRVVFEGADVTRMPPEKRAARGMARTFQITNLFNQLTVEENMLLALRGLSPKKFSLFGRRDFDGDERERADRALDRVRLGGRRNTEVRELSYGEQRQLELALSLVMKPTLLLLDEPAAGLSPNERSIVVEIIRELPRDLTLVLIEHDMDLVLGLVDNVTCLHEGRILVEATPDAIRGNAAVQEVYLGKPRHA